MLAQTDLRLAKNQIRQINDMPPIEWVRTLEKWSPGPVARVKRKSKAFLLQICLLTEEPYRRQLNGDTQKIVTGYVIYINLKYHTMIKSSF